MFHQQPVDEDVAPADTTKEDAVNAGVEEGDKIPISKGKAAVLSEHPAEHIMVEDGASTISWSATHPGAEANDQSSEKPAEQSDAKVTNQDAGQDANQDADKDAD